MGTWSDKKAWLQHSSQYGFLELTQKCQEDIFCLSENIFHFSVYTCGTHIVCEALQCKLQLLVIGEDSSHSVTFPGQLSPLHVLKGWQDLGCTIRAVAEETSATRQRVCSPQSRCQDEDVHTYLLSGGERDKSCKCIQLYSIAVWRRQGRVVLSPDPICEERVW